MDYQKIYDDLIRTRKERVPLEGTYYETHHILPTSLGGKNDPDNLVRLTAREHFLAHWLLWRIYKVLGGKEARSMGYAFRAMCEFNASNSKRSMTSSVMYAEAKEAHSFVLQQKRGIKTKPLTEEHKNNISRSVKKFCEENPEKVGLNFKNPKFRKKALEGTRNYYRENPDKFPLTRPEVRQRIAEGHKGKKKATWPKGYWETAAGIKHKENSSVAKCKYMFPIVQQTLDGEFVKEWENMLEIRKIHPEWSSNIAACLRGKRKYAHEYMWVKLIKTQ